MTSQRKQCNVFDAQKGLINLTIYLSFTVCQRYGVCIFLFFAFWVKIRNKTKFALIKQNDWYGFSKQQRATLTHSVVAWTLLVVRAIFSKWRRDWAFCLTRFHELCFIFNRKAYFLEYRRTEGNRLGFTLFVSGIRSSRGFVDFAKSGYKFDQILH